MKERPALMSAPMVRAILAGAKTQTRRPVVPQPEHVWGWGVSFKDPEYFTAHVRYPGGTQPDPWVRCPYGRPPYREEPGDHLWCRETWRHYVQEGRTVYRADGEEDVSPLLTWRPSIHMPRWASRITLEITSVRVERVQDITDEDARAEGMEAHPYYSPIAQGFSLLWDDLYGKRYPWSSNAWVWVVSFRRVGS